MSSFEVLVTGPSSGSMEVHVGVPRRCHWLVVGRLFGDACCGFLFVREA